MKVQIAYPVPCESPEVWETFKPFVQRFADTWRRFPPGVRAELNLITCGGGYEEALLGIFHGIPVRIPRYLGGGMDLGAQQFLAQRSPAGTFQVNFTSRGYFHRAGWLARLLRARLERGPGLYGMSSSLEGGKFHICTRGHAYDTDDFKLYPHNITSRDQGVFFECGEGCLTDWFQSIGRPTMQVFWDSNASALPVNDRPIPWANGFRDGDQSSVLCFDKHTQAFAEANAEEKVRLHKLCHWAVDESEQLG